ncbi:MAG: sigma-70 family RNA polymerase sigma factor [Candidatus Eisenbacteria bacterium]|nr:sigma-70 family RNA polymerase sigma factor [Candidatus Eisenbacteria bacterium]
MLEATLQNPLPRGYSGAAEELAAWWAAIWEGVRVAIDRDETGSEHRSAPGSDPDSATARSPETERTITLVARARAGDQEALERLCQRYLPRMRRWATGRLPGYARDLLATEDLVQDALYQTVRRLADFRSQHEGAFQVYVRQVLLNRIRDQIRRPHLMRTLEEDPALAAKAASPLEELIGRDTLVRYEEALERLRPEDREAVVARLEMAGTYEELAEVLGKSSADAARMAVGRALARLAREMGHER